MITYVSIDNVLVLDQSVGTSKGLIWKVIDSYNIVTTSGHLNTSTLEKTIDATIQDFQLRIEDFSFTYDGTLVAILHKSDMWEYIINGKGLYIEGLSNHIFFKDKVNQIHDSHESYYFLISQNIHVNGIFHRTLTDNLSITDQALFAYCHSFSDNLNINDLLIYKIEHWRELYDDNPFYQWIGFE